MSSCVLVGLNGGTVVAPHDVTSAADLSLTYTAPQSPAQSIIGMGGEFCFGQNWGCQGATTDDSLSFALVTPITQTTRLVALYGDVSDSTFDGTSSFGAPPAGAWTARNDFLVYLGAECSAFGVTSGIAGPSNYYASIPGDATPLLSVPLSGSGIGVSTVPVFQAFSNVTLDAGDCLVTLWGLQGGGGFDNETQVTALDEPLRAHLGGSGPRLRLRIHRLLRGGRWVLRCAAVKLVTRPQTPRSGSGAGAVLIREAPSRRDRGGASCGELGCRDEAGCDEPGRDELG